MTEIVTTGVSDKKTETPSTTSTDTAATEPEYTALEVQAMEQGWQPESDWVAGGKDPSEHRSAREFLDRGELLSTIKSTKAQLREVTDLVNNLTEHNKQVYVAGYKRALKDLYTKRAEAITQQDAATVAQVDEMIDVAKTRINIAEATPSNQVTTPTTSSAFASFQEANPWYAASSKMKKWAHGEAIDYVQDHPEHANNEAAVYAHLAKEVKKEFPEYFARKNQLPAAPDGNGVRSTSTGNRSTGNGSFEKLMATLPEDQQRVAKDFVKRGIMTKEQYVEQYDSIKRG